MSYHTLMLDYILWEQVEAADQDKKQEGTFYLPHHAVSKGKGGGDKVANRIRCILPREGITLPK
jgi:hypothetical protein